MQYGVYIVPPVPYIKHPYAGYSGYSGIEEWVEEAKDWLKCKIFGDCEEEQKKPVPQPPKTIAVPVRDDRAELALLIGAGALVVALIALSKARK